MGLTWCLRLLAMVGHFLHDTIDYSSLFNKIQNYIQFKNLYLDSKSTTLDEDLKNIEDDEMSDILYQQMSLNREAIERIQIINAQHIMRLRDTAKLALEFAVKKSTTKTELLQCAKYAELEFYNRDWAQEIRKKAYGESWDPSNNEDSDTTCEDFESFIEENKSDLVKSFSTKKPAAYRQFLKEEEEIRKKWK